MTETKNGTRILWGAGSSRTMRAHWMGDYFESFVADEARAMGFTLDELRAWRPAVVPARRRRRRAG
jgi:hypothetical protein